MEERIYEILITLPLVKAKSPRQALEWAKSKLLAEDYTYNVYEVTEPKDEVKGYEHGIEI